MKILDTIGNVLFSLEVETLRECVAQALKAGADLREANLQGADLREADLREANLQGADLQEANLQGADLQGADLRGAILQRANLQRADLQGADLRYANLRGADLRYANLRGANLDFSSFPLWCGSTNVISDDRLFSQLFFHLTRLNVEECSGGVQEAMEALRSIAAADLFCEYREDIERLEDN